MRFLTALFRVCRTIRGAHDDKVIAEPVAEVAQQIRTMREWKAEQEQVALRTKSYGEQVRALLVVQLPHGTTETLRRPQRLIDRNLMDELEQESHAEQR